LEQGNELPKGMPSPRTQRRGRVGRVWRAPLPPMARGGSGSRSGTTHRVRHWNEHCASTQLVIRMSGAPVLVLPMLPNWM